MVVTLTFIRLRSLWGFFHLSWMGLNVSLQARKQKGFVKMKNTGFGYSHYTASVWESVQDAKEFAHSGYHLKAMGQAKAISTEVRIYTFAAEQMPNWKEAKKLVMEKGRVYNY